MANTNTTLQAYPEGDDANTRVINPSESFRHRTRRRASIKYRKRQLVLRQVKREFNEQLPPLSSPPPPTGGDGDSDDGDKDGNGGGGGLLPDGIGDGPPAGIGGGRPAWTPARAQQTQPSVSALIRWHLRAMVHEIAREAASWHAVIYFLWPTNIARGQLARSTLIDDCCGQNRRPVAHSN